MDANDQVTITLPAAKWNEVINAMAEAPFRVVAPLIAEITKQAHGGANGLNGTRPPPAEARHIET
jgi:hypothetical protein